MWLRRILDTPAGALFLFEARRHWAGKQLKLTWGLVLFTALYLCAVAAGWSCIWRYGCEHLVGAAVSAAGTWVGPLYGAQQLLPVAGMGTPLGLLTARAWVGSPFLIRGVVRLGVLLPGLASRFILPGYAARAFAASRVAGRLRDTALLPLGSGGLFLAVGLGAVLPFAAIQLLCVAMALAGYTATLAQGVPLAFRGATWQPHPYLVGLAGITLTPVRVILDAIVLLCVSALCRRTRKAVVLCYLVGLFGTWSIEWAVALFPDGRLDPTRAITAALVTIAVEALALVVLLPRALTVLRYPDE
jgi:hypothetical protein